MTEINIGNTPTEYYTHILNKKYDLYQIFAALPSILPSPPFITGYYITISGIPHDLSQLFIFYPIDVSNGSNITLYYHEIILYLVFSFDS